jgi:hypothetical protein
MSFLHPYACRSRRILARIFAALAFFALALTTGPALADDLSYTDAELLSALESAYWIPLNGPRPKKIYVLASPWCPYCAALHSSIAQNPPDAEFRFILTVPHLREDRIKIGRAAWPRSPESLGKVYGHSMDVQTPLTPAESYAEGLNEALQMAIKPSLQARSRHPIGLPTLIYMSAGKLRVIPGMPPDLAPFAASVDPDGSVQALAATNGAPPKLSPIAAKIVYAREESVTLHIAPRTDAAKFAVLKAGVGFKALAETEQNGERWYAFQFTEDGPAAAFGKVSQFR